MFYKQFSKIIDILDESFVKEFDFWLATLPKQAAKTISVSSVASKFEVNYGVADSIMKFAEKEGILKKRYVIICGNEECQFFYGDFDADELISKVGEEVYCHNCSKEFQISFENAMIVFSKEKDPNVPEKVLEKEILKRIGGTEGNGGCGNFIKADSLAVNADEIYDLYYKPNESAYIELTQLRKSLDGPFKTTKEKGDALEKFALCLFKLIKNVSGSNKITTYTNQFDCTIRFPESSPVFPTVMKYMTPYFIIECKNETTSDGKGKTPSNTYFHKLSDIMSSNNAQIGIVISRGKPSNEDMIIAHDNYLLNKSSNQQKILLSFSEEDFNFLVDQKVNLLKYMSFKMDMLTMNAQNATYDMFDKHKRIGK